MNFKKCGRCGCFYSNDGNVCPSCTPQDNKELQTLNNFFTENQNKISVRDLSNITGITVNNISRFTNYQSFDYKNKIKL